MKKFVFILLLISAVSVKGQIRSSEWFDTVPPPPAPKFAPSFYDYRGLKKLDSTLHTFMILKDTRPGIPPLRLVIHCPHTDRDTVIILNPEYYYFKPDYGYFMYGQSEWLPFGGVIYSGGALIETDNEDNMPWDTTGAPKQESYFEYTMIDGTISYRSSTDIDKRSGATIIRDTPGIWNGKKIYYGWVSDSDTNWKKVGDGKYIDISIDSLFEARSAEPDNYVLETHRILDSIDAEYDKVLKGIKVKQASEAKQDASGIWATVIAMGVVILLIVAASFRKSKNKNES